MLRKYKTSHIDPLRAKKATAALRDAWFELVRSTIVDLHAEGRLPDDWTSFDKIPSRYKYNVDEESKDYNSTPRRFEPPPL